MPTQVSPPNPNMVFVQSDRNSAMQLSPVAFRFLTNIIQALKGQPLLTISGQQIAQFTFGTVTISTGLLPTPAGLLDGNIGDLFISTDGSGGGILFGKTSGSGTTAGWSLIT